MIAVAVAVISSVPAEPKPDNPPVTIKLGTAAYHQESCLGSTRAITFYRQKYRGWREKMGLAGPVSRVWYHDCRVLDRRAAEWRDKARAAHKEYVYQYAWWEWLPANWYRVGSCESGHGGDPNWEHTNRQFTSAFGISWAEYNADAAYMGAPPWHVRHTPRDQYLAALGHYKRFGDGWGCPGP